MLVVDRVDRARSRMQGETGVGLSVVRPVGAHDGRPVLVTSAEGQGSAFVLRLPVTDRTSAADGDAAGPFTEGVA